MRIESFAVPMAMADVLVSRERERLDRQREHDALGSDRNRAGQFATPPELALAIARYASSLLQESDLPVELSDPAVGTGSFYSAALRVLGPGQISSATGVEIDAKASAAARQLWGDLGLKVVNGDFTDREVRSHISSPSLILTNPPYVRHHHLDRDQKRDLQRQVGSLLGIKVGGLAGLYVYYLLLATAWMRDGGLALWLLPSEFLEVNYGAVLRRFLSNRVTLIRVHRFDPVQVQFRDALVTSAVVAFRKTFPGSDTTVQFTFGGTLDEPELQQHISVGELRAEQKWTAFPGHKNGNGRSASNLVLGDFLKIRRGLATGANDFFVIPREKARQRGLEDACLQPILPGPRYLKTQVIECLADGYPDLQPQLALINPPFDEKMLSEQCPAVWQYLQSADGTEIRGRYLMRHRNPWYRQEHRDPAPFLCTYMGRNRNGGAPFRFIRNRSRAVATNVYLMLYPKGDLALLLARGSLSEDAIFDFLTSIEATALRREGRTYGGGLEKLEPKELGRVPADDLVKLHPALNVPGQLRL